MCYCCPHVFGKEPYAGIEYLPIERPPMTHQSLLYARKSISASTHYLPHVSGQVSDHSHEDTDDYDYSGSVITEEPRSMHPQKFPSESFPSHSKSRSGENFLILSLILIARKN